MGKLYFIYVVFEFFCSHDNAGIFWSSEIEDTQSFKYILSFVCYNFCCSKPTVFSPFYFYVIADFLRT